ncbi:uncharacterized protein G2W53_020957 [Senna tora]|uniref:Uncharacterized protein n=1 Tax=Senna tora TaxID=362788 RepID=A0A834WJ61_9FABA|nr:uncharacterized protein G2W53_020957 [Senna tora]
MVAEAHFQVSPRTWPAMMGQDSRHLHVWGSGLLGDLKDTNPTHT